MTCDAKSWSYQYSIHQSIEYGSTTILSSTASIDTDVSKEMKKKLLY